ncbi:Rab family GTPase [Roseivirga echinicomitans]|uniref:GTP-binding protein n=1 Tax=Roseivirga echinicomitans TaxID=296218 RepID=A0A150XYE5_9BACT|nr:Rab family GTPase [Roseivirga echinicomitans]KYG83763.1 GTP-binding protein [Roseivirga echinicomitans]
MNKKVILVGHFGVGKTSLVQQFVYSKFSEKYLTTIGVKIDKKVVEFDGHQMTLLIWDIAGETEQNSVSKSYKLGSHGIIYVFDLTRPSTYENLSGQVEYLKTLLPNAPIQVLGNKKDLLSEEELSSITETIDFPFKTTSAKTGEYVEDAFIDLSKAML